MITKWKFKEAKHMCLKIRCHGTARVLARNVWTDK